MPKKGRAPFAAPEEFRLEYFKPYEAQAIIAAAATLTRSRKMNELWVLVFSILWRTGIRVSEALGLTPADIYPDRIIFVGAKGRRRKGQVPDHKKSHIPIHRDFYEELMDFIAARRIKPHHRIFSVTKQAVWQQTRAAARRAGITGHVHPHMFRHGFAINFIEQSSGEDPQKALAMLKELLRHKDINTTAIYLRPRYDDLVTSIERMKF